MKKVFVLLSAALLSSCAIHAGENSWGEWRREWVETRESFPIRYFSSEPTLLKTEYISEISRLSGVIYTAYVGGSVVSDRMFNKDYYVTDCVKAVMDGGFGTDSIFVEFKKGDVVPILGQATITGGIDVVLIQDKNDPDSVLLIKRDGSIYEHSGVLKYKKLVLVPDEVTPRPFDFHFSPVVQSHVEQTKPVKGFDLRYDGIQKGEMIFTYMVYTPQGEATGEFETFAFPKKAGLYRINDIELKILSVSREKIEFMILNDLQK